MILAQRMIPKNSKVHAVKTGAIPFSEKRFISKCGFSVWKIDYKITESGKPEDVTCLRCRDKIGDK